jgi:hypothetical protein
LTTPTLAALYARAYRGARHAARSISRLIYASAGEGGGARKVVEE